MTKHTYHFKHDFNAHNDENILDLRMELGFEGYGIFWYLVENLAMSTGYQLESNYKRLAFSSHIEESTLRRVIEEFGLFVVKDGFFWSESLRRRMEKLDEIKLKRKENGAKGGKAKAIAYHLLDNSLPNAIANPSKGLANSSRVKESKGEESKEKESKEEKDQKSPNLSGFEKTDQELPKPPKDLNEVLDYCFLEKKLYFFDAWDFYEKNEEANWWRGDGKPVLNWKSYFRTWASKPYAKRTSRQTHSVLIHQWLVTIKDQKLRSETSKGLTDAHR